MTHYWLGQQFIRHSSTFCSDFGCIALHSLQMSAKLCHAVVLTSPDRDLHRFVWRGDPDNQLRDYCMYDPCHVRSSSAANMSVKQNALDLTLEYPQAAVVVEKSFYVDDCLTGANCRRSGQTTKTTSRSLLKGRISTAQVELQSSRCLAASST